MIPYGRQSISDADIDAVIEVLRSDFLTQGPAVPAFEAALATKVGAKHAVAVTNATSALHLACRALGVGPGDKVWVPAVTFPASANCALYCNATVDFVDIDPASANLSVPALRAKLEGGGRPAVVVAVHMCGLPCDMAEIAELAREFDFRVIEDASHAPGSRYGDLRIGACEHSDIAVFSFHPVKIVTTGEGGAALTNDAALAQRMALLRSHGITRDADLLQNEVPGDWYYEQIDLGYNYRMTDIQAALGVSQLDRLEEFVERRNELATRYAGLLANLPLQLPVVPQDRVSSFHLYVVRLLEAARYADVFAALKSAGVGVNLHYIPVYLHPFYRAMGFERGYCPEAEAYHASAITIPLYPSMETSAQDYVAAQLAKLLT